MYKFTKRFSQVLTIILAMLTVTGCAKDNSSPDGSGSATQASSTATESQAVIEEVIRGIYSNVLGRQPTQSELDTDVALVQAGLSTSAIQTALANSPEALEKVATLILQNFGTAIGTNFTATVASWIAALASGKSLAQLIAAGI